MALDQPDLDPGRFRVSGNNDQQLLAAARAAIQHVGPLVKEFLAHAMPERFLERLKGRLDQFERTLAELATSKRTNEDVERSLKRTMQEAVEDGLRLDAAVHNALAGNPSTIAAWESACELRRPRRSRRASEGVASPSEGRETAPESVEPDSGKGGSGVPGPAEPEPRSAAATSGGAKGEDASTVERPQSDPPPADPKPATDDPGSASSEPSQPGTGDRAASASAGSGEPATTDKGTEPTTPGRD